MDFALTTEQNLLVDSLRAFIEQELYPYEQEVDRTGEVTPERAARIRARAIEQGFYAANMPEEVGGAGLDTVTLALVERELGAASWALATHVGRPSKILLACQGEQIERYLMRCVRGEKIECFALTEPGAGSDVMSMSTRADRDGDGFVLNGAKHFISHADIADFAIVFAATGAKETPRGPRKLVTAFLVDKGTPGFDVGRGAICVSNRGYHQNELVFTDCRLGAEQVLGEVHKGFDIAGEWLFDGRLMVAANCVGRARRVLDMTLDWAATRKQFGQTIGRFQGVSFKLADMATELHAAEMMTFHGAWQHDQGTLTDEGAAMAKLFATEMLGRVTDNAVQIFGGMGLMEELPIERFWRDARVERIWEGTSEIQRHIISRAMLRRLGS